MRASADANGALFQFMPRCLVGIVLIDTIDEERRAGRDVIEAIVAAATIRLRPIVMTTLTTILGLVPLHLFEGELWYTMTIVMMFGVGTVLTLGAVPAFYAALFRDGSGRAARDADPAPAVI